MKKILLSFVVGGLGGLALGFTLGIYFLPIIIEEDGLPDQLAIEAMVNADRQGFFRRDLQDSDGLHWGEGQISLITESNGRQSFVLKGELAPGPNYKLYLTTQFVETEEGFLAIKDQSAEVADIKAFSNFQVSVPDYIDTDAYSAVIVWCEYFQQFITSASLN